MHASPTATRLPADRAIGRRPLLAAILGLSASLASGCLGAGYQGTSSETWVHPELGLLGPQRYALLPVDCPEEAIPTNAYPAWRRKRRIELTLHLQRTLTKKLTEAGHRLSEHGLVEAALGRGDLELPVSVRMYDSEQRTELSRRLSADAVIETRVLDGSAERLTIALRAVHLVSGDILWRTKRTDSYHNERSAQVERLLTSTIEELHELGL